MVTGLSIALALVEEALAACQPVGEPVDDDAASEAFGEFADDYLTDGNGYAPASTYEACSKAFNAAWPDRVAATAAARAELKRLHGDDRTVGARRAEALNRAAARDDAADDAAPPVQAVDLAPRPMDTAPTDGTLVRLLVNFTSNPTEDSHGPAWTIGSNNDSNVMADERVGWQFAGWCWDHDHFTEGEGTPVGWLPLVGAPAQAVPDAVQAIIREYLDAEEAFRAATRNNWGPDKRLNHADPLVIRLREARVALRKMAWDATEAQAEVKP